MEGEKGIGDKRHVTSDCSSQRLSNKAGLSYLIERETHVEGRGVDWLKSVEMG
jgi:hypothetical protein